MVRFDRAGEEGDLATWRAIPAKICHSMVSSTLMINAIIPNSDVFATNRKTISRRYPFVFYMSIGAVPMILWIQTTELTLSLRKDARILDNTELPIGFGQVCF